MRFIPEDGANAMLDIEGHILEQLDKIYRRTRLISIPRLTQREVASPRGYGKFRQNKETKTTEAPSYKGSSSSSEYNNFLPYSVVV
jgi:hypothetical protein